MTDIDALIEKAKASGVDVWTAGAVSDLEVAMLEQTLAINLPPSYKRFLLNHGALAVGESTVSGIVDGNVLDESGGSLIGDTKRFRSDFSLPERFLVIQADDDAPYCLDTAQKNEYGEMQIICYELVSGVSNRIAQSFNEWIKRFVFNENV